MGDLAEGTVWLGVPPVRSMTKNLAAGKRFEHFMLDFERNRALLEVPLEPDGKPLKLSGLFGEGTGIRTTWIDFVKGRVVASKEIIELEFETDTRFLEKIKPIEQLTREMSGGLTTASGARIQLSDDIPDYAIMMMGIQMMRRLKIQKKETKKSLSCRWISSTASKWIQDSIVWVVWLTFLGVGIVCSGQRTEFTNGSF